MNKHDDLKKGYNTRLCSDNNKIKACVCANKNSYEIMDMKNYISTVYQHLSKTEVLGVGLSGH